MKNNKTIRRLQCFAVTLILIFTLFGATPVYAAGVAEVTFKPFEIKTYLCYR